MPNEILQHDDDANELARVAPSVPVSATGTTAQIANGLSQPTPGPWRIGEGLRGYEFGIVKRIEMAEIGIADIPEGIHRGEAEANARLIAAAPDLLAALKAMLNDIETGLLVRDVTHDGDSGWSIQMLSFVRRLQDAQVAIARAEGRS